MADILPPDADGDDGFSGEDVGEDEREQVGGLPPLAAGGRRGRTTRQARRKAVTIVEDDSDEDGINLSSSESESSDEDGHGASTAVARRPRPPRPSAAAGAAPRKSLAVAGMNNRRRSSARFLSSNGSGNQRRRRSSIMTGPDGNQDQSRVQNLGELYKKAIRMNAENKINAANSWNLPLIDHIDKFLEEDEEEDDDDSAPQPSGNGNNKSETKKEKRVNFTKASCTLDASVKIYSYRVDDVHLTSYKVLANLSRNDNNKKKKNGGGNGDEDPTMADDNNEDGSSNARRNKKGSSSSGPTLETNHGKFQFSTVPKRSVLSFWFRFLTLFGFLCHTIPCYFLANINLNKLDSAFDIDPLFHKMSKAFDEGGAKGLLLANLGTGDKCNIVFDSSNTNIDGEEDVVKRADGSDEAEPVPAGAGEEDAPRIVASTEEGMIDITETGGKIQVPSFLDDDIPLDSLSLVPQLSSLRAQFDQLENEGFVAAAAAMQTPGRRYAPRESDEREAERSIHKEALERSTWKGQQNRSLFADDDSPSGNGDGEYAADDYGGGYDDDDDDVGFGAFMAGIDENVARFSSEAPFDTQGVTETQNQTTALLDAISSAPSMLLASQSDYDYLDSQALENYSSRLDPSSQFTNNVWAGALHWKRCMNSRRARVVGPEKSAASDDASKKKKPSKSSRKKKKRSFEMLEFRQEPANLSEIAQKPPQKKSSKNAKGKKKLDDPSQWSKAVVTKHSKADNLLPIDAGLGVEHLSKLFLLPNAQLKTKSEKSDIDSGPPEEGDRAKSVNFNMTIQTWDDGGSLGGGDDDDGAGFCFAGDDNDDDEESGFIVPELDDVRKVDKVRVAYATVSKKVDVKRLKRDLWIELEAKLASRNKNDEEEKKEDDVDESDADAEEKVADDESADPTARPTMSFQDAVGDMESSKSQADVTLPFYFICILHLANEKGLRLESKGLEDFDIYADSDVAANSHSF